MSKKFDTEAYVSRWDDKLIPILLAFIVLSMIGAYALNVAARQDCTVHDYVFCGTPLDTYENEEEGGHHGAGKHEGAESHGAAEGQEAAPAHGEAEHGGHPH